MSTKFARYIGISSLLTGFTAYLPKKQPILSLPSGVVLSAINCFLIFFIVAKVPFSYFVPLTHSRTLGCSGATTIKVTLYIVSGLVVKVGIASPVSSNLKK